MWVWIEQEHLVGVIDDCEDDEEEGDDKEYELGLAICVVRVVDFHHLVLMMMMIDLDLDLVHLIGDVDCLKDPALMNTNLFLPTSRFFFT